ncbi:MAG: hypothetical protein DRJ18_00210 [Candidatus Methanomethylicota archaeon]|nr:MAG: hypothetical protein DRJ18_00210 [Candidatus Verstraetearchaeota archaeon]
MRRPNIGAVIIYSEKPMPINELLRIAGAKAKLRHGSKVDFIKFLDYYYFERFGVYCVIYELPNGNVVLSGSLRVEGGKVKSRGETGKN